MVVGTEEVSQAMWTRETNDLDWREYVNDDHDARIVVLVPWVSEEQVREIQEIEDELYSRDPILSPVRITVATDGFELGSLLPPLAESEEGGGILRLHPRTFLASHVDHWMPASRKVSVLRYTLTHEWGHLRAAPAEQRRIVRTFCTLSFPELLSTSEYGAQDAYEFAAESYAEWVLTGGQTTNRATRRLATELADLWPSEGSMRAASATLDLRSAS